MLKREATFRFFRRITGASERFDFSVDVLGEKSFTLSAKLCLGKKYIKYKNIEIEKFQLQ